MKRNFFNDFDGFSIKDFYGVLFSTAFIATGVYALLSTDKETPIKILGYLSNIVLTIVGAKALTEGTKGVMSHWKQQQQMDFEQQPEFQQEQESDESI